MKLKVKKNEYKSGHETILFNVIKVLCLKCRTEEQRTHETRN
jgi:hypothetical protein